MKRCLVNVNIRKDSKEQYDDFLEDGFKDFD
jgi:hypothetical protein